MMNEYVVRRLLKAFEEKLSTREADVFKMTHGIFEYDRKYSAREVGEKYGVTAARIIQINKVSKRVLVTLYGVDILKLTK